MMSSISAMALAPAHPQAAKHQAAAVDKGHPQVEPFTDEKIADQRECANTKADHDKGVSDPESGDDVEQHEIDRPERAHLAQREVAEHVGAEKTEGEEQQERDQSLVSLEEVAITRAPASFANCSAKIDTPPVPCVSTVCPGLALPSLTTALHAVSPAQGSDAASASPR